MKRLLIAAPWFLLQLQLMPAQPLQSGVAVVDITPPAGIEMWGAAGRKGFAESTLDSLEARILTVKHGDISIALLTLDLGRPFSRDQIDRVRSAVRKSVG